MAVTGSAFDNDGIKWAAKSWVPELQVSAVPPDVELEAEYPKTSEERLRSRPSRVRAMP